MLLYVDGTIATEQNVEILLRGNDKPGSIAMLTIAKSGKEVESVHVLFHRSKKCNTCYYD